MFVERIIRHQGLRVVLPVALVLLGAACTSAPIQQEPPIMPPPGASLAQVDRAIHEGIMQANQGVTTGIWVVEKNAPGVVVAGIRVRGNYLQVTFNYSKDQIVSTITNSIGLGQEGDKINKHANTWHVRLDDYVRQQLGAGMQMGSRPG